MNKISRFITGLVIVMVTGAAIGQPSNTTLISHWDQDSCYQMEIIGDFLYFLPGSFSEEITILDISDPTNLEQIGTISFDDSIRYVEKLYSRENYLYLLSEVDCGNVEGPCACLLTYDVSDAAYPVWISSLRLYLIPPNSDGVCDVYKVLSSDSSLFISYFAGGWGGNFSLVAVSLQDQSDPFLYELDSNFTSVYNHYINSNYMYMSSDYPYLNQGALCVYDVSDPTSIDSVGEWAASWWYSSDVPLFHVDYAYFDQTPDSLAAAIRIIDISNPENLNEVGQWNLEYDLTSISTDGRFFYVMVPDSGIRIFDAVNPLSPVEVGYFDHEVEFHYNPSWQAYPHQQLKFSNDHIYFAGKDSGLYVFRNDLAVNIDQSSTELPFKFELEQNYPNPFNPITTISYELSKRSDVQITIYDLLGRKVTTLVSETQDAGFKSVRWDATNAASGVHFCRLQADDFSKTIKMVLLH